MYHQTDNLLTFMEEFTKRLVVQTECDFLFEGVCVASDDVASSRGLLPVIMDVVRLQASVCRNTLPDDVCGFLYNWSNALETVNDADTLTGKKLVCRDDSLNTDICWYTMCAALIVAVEFMKHCSDTPQTIHFDNFREEHLYADNDGIQPA